MTPRVILDTNVVVSAALDIDRGGFPHGRPVLVIRLALSAAVDLVASDYLLAEYEVVLHRRRFGLPANRVQAFIRLLRRRCELVVPAVVPAALVRDPDDAPVLGTARHGPAGPTSS